MLTLECPIDVSL